jgi:Pentapeptide repeats (8 copies)
LPYAAATGSYRHDAFQVASEYLEQQRVELPDWKVKMAGSSSKETGRVSAGSSLTVHLDRGPALPPESVRGKIRRRIIFGYVSRASTITLIAMSIIFASALFGFIILLLGPTTQLIAGRDTQGLHGTALLNALDGIRQTLVAAAAGFAAAVGLAFTARTYALSRRSQEVDRFTRAVSLLSSDKQSERIGGLLTIEYIIRERTTEAIAAVEVICAFIRERANVTHESYHDVRSHPRSWGHVGDMVADDIFTALRIIGVNYPRPQRSMLNLSGTDMHGCGLAGTNFSGVRLFNCLMEGVSFVGADLKHSRLDGSVMVGAWLEGTDLRRATLRNVDLRGANLIKAQIDASQLLPAIIDDTTVLDEDLKVRLDELRNEQG